MSLAVGGLLAGCGRAAPDTELDGVRVTHITDHYRPERAPLMKFKATNTTDVPKEVELSFGVYFGNDQVQTSKQLVLQPRERRWLTEEIRGDYGARPTRTRFFLEIISVRTLTDR